MQPVFYGFLRLARGKVISVTVLSFRLSAIDPDPGGRDRVAAGRPACQRAARVLHWATALRVTRRPSRGSDGSYGPCGPAWTGASRPSTTPTGRGKPPDSGWRAGREPVGVGVKRRRQAGGLWLRVERMVSRARGLREGDGGSTRGGGGRAARPRLTPTRTFGPGARRVPRRAPLQSEPPGGLVRPSAEVVPVPP